MKYIYLILNICDGLNTESGYVTLTHTVEIQPYNIQIVRLLRGITV